MLSPIILFFLHCVRHPRALHSFPTRRSSDLPLIQTLPSASPLNSSSTSTRPGRWGDVELELDRKSTRLNSSHRCISYAVFCLKKKTAESNGNIGSGT